jgi:hypothetical protein
MVESISKIEIALGQYFSPPPLISQILWSPSLPSFLCDVYTIQAQRERERERERGGDDPRIARSSQASVLSYFIAQYVPDSVPFHPNFLALAARSRRRKM